jgi:hypothetical protein
MMKVKSIVAFNLFSLAMELLYKDSLKVIFEMVNLN